MHSLLLTTLTQLASGGLAVKFMLSAQQGMSRSVAWTILDKENLDQLGPAF
jgi:hypothetical protein